MSEVIYDFTPVGKNSLLKEPVQILHELNLSKNSSSSKFGISEFPPKVSNSIPSNYGESATIKISRAWAMPSRHTFLITPISGLLKKYVGNGKGWIDPFAGENSPAEITNDLNPNKPATFHLHAKEFATQLTGTYEGVLFDPPYSLTQLKQCYESVGLKMFQDDSQRFPQNVKEVIAPKIKAGGLAITFGWNSQGFGKNLGFELIEVLLVPHGRSHNDTVVTVERKFTNEINFN